MSETGHHQDLHDAAVELSKAVANLISINQTLRDALILKDQHIAALGDDLNAVLADRDRIRDEIERLRANKYEGRIDRIPRVQQLEDKLKRFQVNWDKLCQMHEAEQARVQELRGIIYRITAPTASQVEEDDRAAAFEEGRELTDPNAARTARWKARYPSDS